MYVCNHRLHGIPVLCENTENSLNEKYFRYQDYFAKILAALLLIGVIVFAGLPTKVEAESPGSYNTNFDWDGQEEAEHEWPLPAEPALAKTRTGIGTAGFAYSRGYYNDEGRNVLEIDFSILPDTANNELKFQIL